MKPPLIVALLVIAGLALGLAYSWLINPIHITTDVSPEQVITSYQHTWISMAAEAFAQDGDWERTNARLAALRDPDLAQTVTALFDRLDAQGPRAAARAMAVLADRLGARTANMTVYLITPVATPTTTSTPIANPAATATPRPIGSLAPTPRTAVTTIPSTLPTTTPDTVIPSPVPTYNPVYRIFSQIAECTRGNAAPQIRVTTQDANGQNLPGVTVWIIWEGGADRFVTGLKPEVNTGYGDFDMLRDRAYNVSIDQRESIIASGLRTEPCAGGGSTSWRLVVRSAAR